MREKGKKKNMLSVFYQKLKLEVDQRFRPKGLRLRENKAVEIILVEVNTKMFGNLSFRYLIKRAFY